MVHVDHSRFVTRARGRGAPLATVLLSRSPYMLDQCHNIEKKIPGQIRSVLNVQESARALLVDTDALTRAQEDGDVLLANEIFMDAFYTDVRRDLAGWREERGLPADPMAAYLASGYQEQIEADRVGGTQAGWN
jgi:L-rhamnose isomerase/sugar isomerase